MKFKNDYMKKNIAFIISIICAFCIYGNAFGQSADLIIQKTGPNQVYVGQSMQYTFVIANNGPNDVTNATWNDNLPTGMTNVTFVSCTALGGAVCPSGGSISISNTNFSGTIPFLPVNGTITMVISMNAPAPTTSTSFSNTATVSVPSSVTELDPSTNSSTWNTTILTRTDISVSKTVNKTTTNCGVLPDTLEYTVTWVNGGPSAANGVSVNEFFDVVATATGTGNASYTFPISVFDEVWTASSGSSVLTDTLNHQSLLQNIVTGQSFIATQSFVVPIWEAGDTISLRFKFRVGTPTITGCGRNVSLNFRNRAYFTIPGNITLIDTVSANNNSLQTSTILSSCMAPACPTTDISVSKTVNKTTMNCGVLPDTLEYTVTWVNGGPSAANGVSVNEFFDVVATATGTGNASYTFPISVFDEVWTASSGSSVLTDTLNHQSLLQGIVAGHSFIATQSFVVPIWEAGDTISLRFKFRVGTPTITGCGRNVSLNFRNRAYFTIPGNITLIDTVSANNNSLQTSTILSSCMAPACPTTDISVSKTVNKTTMNCGVLPDTLEYTVTWVNGGPSAANGVSVNEFFDVVATATGTGNASYTFPISVFDEVWTASSGSSVLTDTLIPPIIITKYCNWSIIYSDTIVCSTYMGSRRYNKFAV
jgi:uncharacterized repeat protein (TIGR01451 family)